VYPTAAIGPFEISLYTAMRVTAVVILGAGLVLRLRRGCWPITARMLFDGLPWLIVGLIVGSMLESVLPHLANWATRGIPFPPRWWVESRWLGALGAASLAGYAYCRRRGLPAGRAFDLFAVPLPLALAVARVGCLLAGCCGGRETAAWPALVLPDVHGVWASRYPTQPAEIVADLLIFLLLVAFERYTLRVKAAGWPFGGFLYLLFAALHLGQRFLIEFWRADTPCLIGPLTWQQLLCAIGLGLTAWLIMRLLKRRLPAKVANL
jgi:phosphatidylglycerol:prolipoprotein diacylglycerol transferase